MIDSLVLHKTPMPGSLSTGVASHLDSGAPSRNHQRIWEVDRLSGLFKSLLARQVPSF